MLQFTYLYFLIFYFILKVFICSDARFKEMFTQCVQAGMNWKSIYETANPNNLTDPYTCTQISQSCCFISIKYSFNSRPVEETHCFPLTGQPSSWINKIKNIIKDDMMYYANFTNDFSQTIKSIGGNLVYNFYKNYTCMELHPLKDYSDYHIRTCAAFDANGLCLFENDEEYFEKYAKVLYENVTSDYCFNYDDNGNCIYYKDNSQPEKLLPLLEILKHDLIQEEQLLDEIDKRNKTVYNWPQPCKPIPEVNVNIICPQEYISARNMSSSFLFLILLSILILI
jgi:hypothetical protein